MPDTPKPAVDDRFALLEAARLKEESWARHRRELEKEAKDRSRSARKNGLWALGGLGILSGLGLLLPLAIASGPIGWIAMGCALLLVATVTAVKGAAAIGARADARDARNTAKKLGEDARDTVRDAVDLDFGDIDENRKLGRKAKAVTLRREEETHAETIADKKIHRQIEQMRANDDHIIKGDNHQLDMNKAGVDLGIRNDVHRMEMQERTNGLAGLQAELAQLKQDRARLTAAEAALRGEVRSAMMDPALNAAMNAAAAGNPNIGRHLDALAAAAR